MNGPDPPHWTINSCVGASRSVWVHLVMFHYYTKLGAKWVKLVQSLCHEFIMEFFATNAPDPLHLTLNSCFGASRSIWLHLAMFCYYTKLGAKQGELVQLMQKFVP